MSMEVALWILFGLGFFYGLMVGTMMGQRENPNEPKPKTWEDQLQRKWMAGFKAGEKLMAKQMSRRLAYEERYGIMKEEEKSHV